MTPSNFSKIYQVKPLPWEQIWPKTPPIVADLAYRSVEESIDPGLLHLWGKCIRHKCIELQCSKGKINVNPSIWKLIKRQWRKSYLAEAWDNIYCQYLKEVWESILDPSILSSIGKPIWLKHWKAYRTKACRAAKSRFQNAWKICKSTVFSNRLNDTQITFSNIFEDTQINRVFKSLQWHANYIFQTLGWYANHVFKSLGWVFTRKRCQNRTFGKAHE